MERLLIAASDGTNCMSLPYNFMPTVAIAAKLRFWLFTRGCAGSWGGALGVVLVIINVLVANDVQCL
jgi:hypothetical protein